MNILKGKRSQVLLYGLIFGFLTAIAVSYFINIGTKKEFPVIGESSLALIKSSKEAEKALFYIDQSAKYALQQAIYELAQNGGVPEFYYDEEILENENKELQDNKCGKFYGYSLWYEMKRDGSVYIRSSCFDEKLLSTSLQYIFNKELSKYLINYPENILTNNYDYEISGSLELLGRAIAPLKFYIIKNEEKKITEETSKTPEGLVDFTGTELCAKGARCMLAEEAYQLLLKADEIAKKKGVSLEVYSSYRDPAKQKNLWEVTYVNVPESERRRLVCYPYGNDVEERCPHLSGNAVDIRFKGKTELASKDLYKIMSEAGWVKYAYESWHFECCETIRYARAKEEGVTEIV